MENILTNAKRTATPRKPDTTGVAEVYVAELHDGLRTTGMLSSAESSRWRAERATRLADYHRRCEMSDALPLPRSPRPPIARGRAA